MKKTQIIILTTVFMLFFGLAKTSNAQTPDESETKAIFDLFFDAGAGESLDEITNADKEMALFLFKELLEKSCQESSIVGSAFTRPTLASLAVSIIKTSFTDCSNGTQTGKYYENIRVTIAIKWKSAFEIRKQTGEW